MTVKHRAAGRRLRMPSPAMIVACLALAVALSGASYAAVVLPRNSVGTPQLKRNAVTSAKVQDNALTGQDINEAQLAQVPSAASANTANTAANATNATNATNAANADKLDGLDSNDFMRKYAAFGRYSNTFVRQKGSGFFRIASIDAPAPLGSLEVQCVLDGGFIWYRNASAGLQTVWVSSETRAGHDSSVYVLAPNEARTSFEFFGSEPDSHHFTFVVLGDGYAHLEVMLSRHPNGDCFGTTDVSYRRP